MCRAITNNKRFNMRKQATLTDKKVMATFTLKATAHAVSVATGTVLLFPPAAVRRLRAKVSSSPAGSGDNNGLLALMAVTIAISLFTRPSLCICSKALLSGALADGARSLLTLLLWVCCLVCGEISCGHSNRVPVPRVRRWENRQRRPRRSTDRW